MVPHVYVLSRLQGSAFATAAASCLAAPCKLFLSSEAACSPTALCTLQQQNVRVFSCQNTSDQQFVKHVTSASQSAGAKESNGGGDGLNPFNTTSSEAVTSTGGEGFQGEGSRIVFTGTAEVESASSTPESDVATDANRHWMSADDLGTRATAATAATDAGCTDTTQQQQHRQGDSQQIDDLCHPADPFCQAGEEAPMPDGFHEPEPGDDHIPPSSGFPA